MFWSSGSKSKHLFTVHNAVFIKTYCQQRRTSQIFNLPWIVARTHCNCANVNILPIFGAPKQKVFEEKNFNWKMKNLIASMSCSRHFWWHSLIFTWFLNSYSSATVYCSICPFGDANQKGHTECKSKCIVFSCIILSHLSCWACRQNSLSCCYSPPFPHTKNS